MKTGRNPGPIPSLPPFGCSKGEMHFQFTKATFKSLLVKLEEKTSNQKFILPEGDELNEICINGIVAINSDLGNKGIELPHFKIAAVYVFFYFLRHHEKNVELFIEAKRMCSARMHGFLKRYSRMIFSIDRRTVDLLAADFMKYSIHDPSKYHSYSESGFEFDPEFSGPLLAKMHQLPEDALIFPSVLIKSMGTLFNNQVYRGQSRGGEDETQWRAATVLFRRLSLLGFLVGEFQGLKRFVRRRFCRYQAASYSGWEFNLKLMEMAVGSGYASKLMRRIEEIQSSSNLYYARGYRNGGIYVNWLLEGFNGRVPGELMNFVDELNESPASNEPITRDRLIEILLRRFFSRHFLGPWSQACARIGSKPVS